jgi:hypothetical protein
MLLPYSGSINIKFIKKNSNKTSEVLQIKIVHGRVQLCGPVKLDQLITHKLQTKSKITYCILKGVEVNPNWSLYKQEIQVIF